MIFIAILDPVMSMNKEKGVKYSIEHNAGYQQHLKWVKTYCAQHRIQLQEPIIIPTLDMNWKEYDCASYVKKQLSLAFSKYDNIYVYFHCHGQTSEEGEFVYLNKQSKLYDTELMAILKQNKAYHITMFFETCHSSGLYDPKPDWYVVAKQVPQNPKYVYNFIPINGKMTLCAAPGNFTLFFCSITEDQSYTKTRTDTKSGDTIACGLATNTIIQVLNGKSMFDYKPTEIRNLLNKKLYNTDHPQYAIVESPVLIPVWFF